MCKVLNADLICQRRELQTVEFPRRNRLPHVDPVKKSQSSHIQQDYTGVKTTALTTNKQPRSVLPFIWVGIFQRPAMRPYKWHTKQAAYDRLRDSHIYNWYGQDFSTTSEHMASVWCTNTDWTEHPVAFQVRSKMKLRNNGPQLKRRHMMI